MLKLTSYVALLFICLTPPAIAWDNTGHRVISAIAYRHLVPGVKQKIDHLTALSDPDYPALSRFLYLSTLPDKWRQIDHGVSGSWHFMDLPWSSDGTPTLPAAASNLLTRLAQFQPALQNPNTPLAEQATALAYVVHLTEDAHQPLHCINRFSRSFPYGDKGGNLFPIQASDASNLHQLWDQSARLILAYSPFGRGLGR
jgi:hypothetical protein